MGRFGRVVLIGVTMLVALGFWFATSGIQSPWLLLYLAPLILAAAWIADRVDRGRDSRHEARGGQGWREDPITPGMARLLLFREGPARAAPVEVKVNGLVRARLKPGRVAALDLAPGRHLIEATARDVGQPGATEIDLLAGETAAVRVGSLSGQLAPEPLGDDLRRMLGGMTAVAPEG